jgi:uncharacterized protein YceK
MQLLDIKFIPINRFEAIFICVINDTMKALKNFLLGLLVIASMSGCGLMCKQKQQTPTTYGTSMRILYDRDFTRAQFDSICVADTIPMNLELWKAYSSRDYETSAVITEYMYIKRLGANEELFRLMIKEEDLYNIYKRITYGNKEE